MNSITNFKTNIISAINDIQDNTDTLVNKSILVSKNTNGDYNEVMTNTDGHLLMDVDEPLGAFGDLICVPLTPQIQLNFIYNVNSLLTTTTTAGSGTITNNLSMCVVGSGSTTGSSALLESKKIAKYYPGQGFVCRFTAKFPNIGLSGSAYAEIGMGTTDNGLLFGYDTEGVYINRRSYGIDNKVYQTNWNRDKIDGSVGTSFTFRGDYINVFQISIAWLGAGLITFKVMSPSTGRFITVHTINYPNTSIVPSVDNIHMPFRIFVDNGGTTSDVILSSASIGVFVEGVIKRETGSIISHFGNTVSASGTNAHLITIRNRAVYNTKTNFLSGYLKNISLSADGTKNTKFSIIKNAVLSGQTYTLKNANNSILEYATNGTYTSGGEILLSINVGKVGSELIKFSDSDNIYISPSETLTVVFSTATTSDIDVDLSILEDF